MTVMPQRSVGRPSVPQEELDAACVAVEQGLFERIQRHGDGTLASRHELLGVLTEEFHEVIDAIHRKDSITRQPDAQAIREELIDVAVTCLFGIACIDNKSLEW